MRAEGDDDAGGADDEERVSEALVDGRTARVMTSAVAAEECDADTVQLGQQLVDDDGDRDGGWQAAEDVEQLRATR